MKHVFQSTETTSEANEARKSVRQTLFTCLFNGLKLISPFMPFVSEELFQRLPRSDPTPSICVAQYPEVSVSLAWRNANLEKEFEFVQKTAKVIRSARSDYNVPNKTKTHAYAVTQDDATNATLKKFRPELCAISFCGEVQFDCQAKDTAAGCAILTVSGQLDIYLLLKGLIDTAKELVKQQKKRDQLEQVVQRLVQSIAAADYEVKVPAEVQQANTEKLTESQSEIERVAIAMESLRVIQEAETAV